MAPSIEKSQAHVRKHITNDTAEPYLAHMHQQAIIKTLGLPHLNEFGTNASTFLLDNNGLRTPILFFIPSQDTTLVLHNEYEISWKSVAKAVALYFHRLGAWLMTGFSGAFLECTSLPGAWALNSCKLILTMGHVPKFDMRYSGLRIYNIATISEKLRSLIGQGPGEKLYVDLPMLNIISTKEANDRASVVRGLGKREIGQRPRISDESLPPCKDAREDTGDDQVAEKEKPEKV